MITDKFNGSLVGEEELLEGYVSGYAYNATPDVGLSTGVIPEPSGGLLAVGAAGLALLRRSKF